MAAGESLRTKFTGNTSLYVFIARFRPPIFLKRNIETVLRESERRRRREEETALRQCGPDRTEEETGLQRCESEGTEEDSEVSSVSEASIPSARWSSTSARFPTRRTESLSQIINRLRPPIPLGGRLEPVLKIEGRSLRRRRLSEPRTHPPSSGKLVRI